MLGLCDTQDAWVLGETGRAADSPPGIPCGSPAPCLRCVCAPKLKEPHPAIIRMTLPAAPGGVILAKVDMAPPQVPFAAVAGAFAFSFDSNQQYAKTAARIGPRRHRQRATGHLGKSRR